MEYNARYLSLLSALVADSDEKQVQEGQAMPPGTTPPRSALTSSPEQLRSSSQRPDSAGGSQGSQRQREGRIASAGRPPYDASSDREAQESADKSDADARKQEFIRARNRLYQQKCRGRTKVWKCCVV
jgi:hypothetical protein